MQTAEFIKRWCKEKCILLPVICGNDFTEFDKIDIAIIPGMAFDRNHNRLGRGKGFYDRLLPKIKAPKIGICFSFQVVDEVPVDELDIPLDEVWTENGKLL